jgi:hypothetical protein
MKIGFGTFLYSLLGLPERYEGCKGQVSREITSGWTFHHVFL